MAEHKERMTLATAALFELIARQQAMQAAVLRGDGADVLDRMRAEAHDVLDAYLDRAAEAAVAVKAILGD
jgi:hypothetical protein